jgi:hypothetical protein
MKGFFIAWRTLITNFVFRENVAIKVNDDIGKLQGDPLSPMLLNIVADIC